MIVTTTNCAAYGQPEFTLEADERVVPDVYIRDAAEILEDMVAGGSVFKPDGTLTLREPDMKSMPVAWTPGVTQTLRMLALQRLMLESFGLDGQWEDASLQQAAIVCPRYGDADFIMSRRESEGARDSGWSIVCVNESCDHNNPRNLSLVSMYEAYLRQPGVQHWACFPFGTEVLVFEGTVRVFSGDDENPLSVVAGTLMDAWAKQGRVGVPDSIE